VPCAAAVGTFHTRTHRLTVENYITIKILSISSTLTSLALNSYKYAAHKESFGALRRDKNGPTDFAQSWAIHKKKSN
jgi:hypothetical protein